MSRASDAAEGIAHITGPLTALSEAGIHVPPPRPKYTAAQVREAVRMAAVKAEELKEAMRELREALDEGVEDDGLEEEADDDATHRPAGHED